MAKEPARKRAFAADLGRRVLEAVDQEEPQVASRTELARRGTTLTKLASDIEYTQNQWIDPSLCRPSPVNARDYAALTYEDCADLIETLKSEGRQRTPAIVRPTDDPDHPYEIVAGLRRHWSICWLRANSYPDFRYLINVQKLDDEAAFRFSDLENRARTDITDLERARSYREALDRYYYGDQARMAERIGISRRNLVRYIQLADLDSVFVEALGGHRQVRLNHAEEIIKAAKPITRLVPMKAEAAAIIDEVRAGGGQGTIAASEAIKRIVKASTDSRRGPKKAEQVTLNSAAGQPMVKYLKARSGLTITVLPRSSATKEELRAAVLKILDEAL